jgi:hypothetical protein
MKFFRFYARYVLTLIMCALACWISGLIVNIWVFAFFFFLPNFVIFLAMVYLGVYIIIRDEKEK